jgi:glycosyltransferase involved in cell wall biosynthesis
MERFIEQNVPSYDLVVTHNSIFRPAQVAIAASKQHGVPSILLPHAHLDDDFYHFPDVMQAALDADLVLACPRAACDFFVQRGAKAVAYHSPGIDLEPPIADADLVAFRAIYKRTEPFFVVLGRKAPAKGYQVVIDAVETLSRKHKVHLLLIGPDDDGAAITSPHATYLGMQPRNIVRAALASCLALVNMSRSESFGMVLLECWLEARPVIANAECAAFADLVAHGENGFLTGKDDLAASMEYCIFNGDDAKRMGFAGKMLAEKSDWKTVGERFVAQCIATATPK